MQNTLKFNEQRRMRGQRTFKIEIQQGGPNNLNILKNWFPPEIRSPPSLISTNLKAMREALQNHTKSIEI